MSKEIVKQFTGHDKDGNTTIKYKEDAEGGHQIREYAKPDEKGTVVVTERNYEPPTKK